MCVMSDARANLVDSPCQSRCHARVASPTSDDLILGRYRRVAVAGRGSFGRVLQVIDVEAGAARAMKIVPPGPYEDGLLDEFEQLAQLAHPSLPRVFEVGRLAAPLDGLPVGSPWFVAEWIAGGRSDERAWTDPAALWGLLADVAGALASIHAAGIVHGDVAPQNLLVAADGRTVLVDLGLAGATGATHEVRGTPMYMAPEAFGGRAEPRSDLYGLGAAAIRLASGEVPFAGAGLGDVIQEILGGRVRALEGVPRPLADLIARLVSRDVDARPASAIAVLDELDSSRLRSHPPRHGVPPVVGPRRAGGLARRTELTRPWHARSTTTHVRWSSCSAASRRGPTRWSGRPFAATSSRSSRVDSRDSRGRTWHPRRHARRGRGALGRDAGPTGSAPARGHGSSGSRGRRAPRTVRS